MSSSRAAALWVVLSACCYSLFSVFAKWALDDLSPTDLLLWRFVVATPVAWTIVLVRARRGGPGPRGAPARTMVPAGMVFGVLALLAFAGLDHLSAALYTVIINIYPALVAIGATMLGRKQPRQLWIAIGITLLGIALTVPEVFGGSADADGLGLVLTLLNAALYAGYVLATGALVGRRAPRPDGSVPPAADGLVMSAWSVTGSLILAAVVVLVVGDLTVPSSADVWLSVLGLGVISTVVAGMALFLGMRTLSPPTAALIATLEPVLTLVWAVTILGESLVALQVVGAALVLGGVVWAQRTSAAPTVVPVESPEAAATR